MLLLQHMRQRDVVMASINEIRRTLAYITDCSLLELCESSVSCSSTRSSILFYLLTIDPKQMEISYSSL